MQCLVCGAALRPTHKICITCGTVVSGQSSAPKTVEPAAAWDTEVSPAVTAPIAPAPTLKPATPRRPEPTSLPAPVAQAATQAAELPAVPLMAPVLSPKFATSGAPEKAAAPERNSRTLYWAVAGSLAIVLATLGVFNYQARARNAAALEQADQEKKAAEVKVAADQVIKDAEVKTQSMAIAVAAAASAAATAQVPAGSEKVPEVQQAPSVPATTTVVTPPRPAAPPINRPPRVPSAPPPLPAVVVTEPVQEKPPAPPPGQPPAQAPAIAAAPPVVSDIGNPQRDCADRTNLVSRAICEGRQCARPEFLNHSYCVALRSRAPAAGTGADSRN